MPFASESQRRFLWKFHPKVAQEWADKYGTPKHLPYHKSKSKGKRRRARLKR